MVVAVNLRPSVCTHGRPSGFSSSSSGVREGDAVASRKRILAMTLLLFSHGLWLIGCSTKPKHLYEGPRQAASDLVLIEAINPHQAGLYAIDGERVYRSASVLLEPGEYELVVRVRMRRQVDLMIYDMQTFCAFYLTGAPGESYRLKPDNKVHKSDTRGDQVSMGAKFEGGADQKSVVSVGCG